MATRVAPLVITALVALTALAGQVAELARLTAETPAPPDFAPFYRAGRALLEAQPLYDLELIGRTPFSGIFKLPPTVAVLMAPLALLDEPVAGTLWRVLTLLGVIASYAIVAAALSSQPTRVAWWVGLAATLVADPVSREVADGQVNWITLLGLSLAIAALLRARRAVEGAGLALAASVKVFPAALLAAPLAARRWDTLAWAAGAGIAMLGVSVVVAGADAWWTWLTRVSADLGAATAWEANQSPTGWLLRRFGPDIVRTPSSLEYAMRPVPWLTALASGFGAAVAVVTVVVAARVPRDDRAGAALGLALVAPALLLMIPVAWTNYAMLALPLVWLVITPRWPVATVASPWHPVGAAAALVAAGTATLLPQVGWDYTWWIALLVAVAPILRAAAPPARWAIALVAVGYGLTAIGISGPAIGEPPDLFESKTLAGTLLLWTGGGWLVASRAGPTPAPARRLVPALVIGAALLGATFGGWRDLLRAATYPIQPAAPASATPIGARFEDGISLVAATMPAEATPGSTVFVVLYWSAAGRPRADYTVFVQIYDEIGRPCGQHDARPNDQRTPTILWLPGDVVADTHRVTIPLACAPGTYGIHAGLYTLPEVRRLRLLDSGSSVRVGDLVIR